MLRDIHALYNKSILAEAVPRFGFDEKSIHELEGTNYVFEGTCDGHSRILKITPGIWNIQSQVTGSTREQILAELDFVMYLAHNGLQESKPLLSRNGEWVELIPIDEDSCFLVDAFEKAPGILYPDDDEVIFPDAFLFNWGKTCGCLHKLSVSYQPKFPVTRLQWYQTDLLEMDKLIPAEQTGVLEQKEKILSRMKALPQVKEGYGLIHGDFHHGNFMLAENKITLFDFDATEYSLYAAEVCIALYNCLPLPRSKTERRREYALNCLVNFFDGYRTEKAFSSFWLQQIPLFLKYCEILSYAYYYKYWDMSSLTERRSNVLIDVRRRIEQETPVVSFEQGDLSF